MADGLVLTSQVRKYISWSQGGTKILCRSHHSKPHSASCVHCNLSDHAVLLTLALELVNVHQLCAFWLAFYLWHSYLNSLSSRHSTNWHGVANNEKKWGLVEQIMWDKKQLNDWSLSSNDTALKGSAFLKHITDYAVLKITKWIHLPQRGKNSCIFYLTINLQFFQMFVKNNIYILIWWI